MRSTLCSNCFPWIPIIIGVLVALSSAAGGTPAAPSEAPPPFAVEIHGQGRPVLLIPGLGSPGSVWDSTVEALVADGYQAHVFTLAGFAGQPAMQLEEGQDFLTEVRQGLVIYARGLGQPPALVGHSLGGTLALWLAATEPDLFSTVVAVDGVAFLPALMNPQATEESARAQAEAMTAAFRGMTPEAYDTQTAYALSTMITDPAIARRMAEASRGTDPATAGAAMSTLMTHDLRDELATIKAPVLLLAAGAAAPTPDATADLRARYEDQIAAVPDHRVEVVANARHFIMLDQPRRFLELLRGHLAEHATKRVEEVAHR